MTNTKRLIRLPKVEDKIGYKHTTIYRMIAEGSFPSPVRLGARAVAWDESLVDAWIESRIQASGGDHVA